MTRSSQRNQGTKAEIKQRRKEKKGKKEKKENKEISWIAFIFRNAPLHHLGHYLDRYGFAALETVSPGMRENLRMIIRTRNQKLPVEKQMANLNEQFIVWKVCKKLLQLEKRYPLDMITTGGYIDDDEPSVNTVMSLDLVTMRYTTLAPMIHRRQGHASAVLDVKLFVMGGVNNDGCLSSVECLDLETGQRSDMAPMITPRARLGAAVLGGKIYVAGGEPVNTVGTSVESFDPATNQWTAVTPMNTSRCSHGLVSAQGKLFAVGGFNNQDGHLSSVECFDPSRRVWSKFEASLNTTRYGLAVAVLGDKLYAIGGRGSQNQRLSSVECLDLSVPNSQWSTVAPMTSPRSIMGAVVTGGKIYIVGGYGSCSIECFDPSDGPAGRWTVVSETSQFVSSEASFSVC
jgi:hypothetical protein